MEDPKPSKKEPRLETIGRRLYFRDAPFSAKDQLRRVGATWEPEEKAWWVSTSRKDLAEALLRQWAQGPKEGIHEDDKVLMGRATYQGQSCYVLWSGERDGAPLAKLVTRDGKKVFWAKGPELSIQATYKTPTSINALKLYVSRMIRESKGGPCECFCHGRDYCTCLKGFCQRHHDGCDSCGCEG